MQKIIYVLFLLVFIAIIVSKSLIAQQLVINEIMFNPINSEPEWIELLNNTNSPILNSPFLISDPTKIYNFKIDSLGKNCYCILVKDTNLIKQYRQIPDTVKLIQAKIPSLNNDKDSLRLFTADTVEIDYFFYKGTWAAKGISLERASPDLPADNENNLKQCKSIDSATCGKMNSCFQSSHIDTIIAKDITIKPNPFSPNSTNGKSKCVINISSDKVIKKLNIKIYNLQGNLIKTILDETNLMKSGKFIYEWDGTNENGFIQQVGVYPILIELEYDGVRATLTAKKLIVLAG
jgi:hypothetical protein